jgi:hypothetical protein
LISERHNIAGAEAVCDVEGNMCGAAMRGADALPGLQTHHAQKERVGTWEVSRPAGRHAAPVRIGKVRSRSR